MGYKVKLYHLYPDAMNLYGDFGNVLALQKRCQWRNIGFEIVNVKIGDQINFKDADIIYMGGGQDRGQKIIQNDLKKRKLEIQSRIESGLVALTICGGFQLFGKYFKTKEGEEISGIEVFDATTVAGDKRFIGNVVVDISATTSKWAEKFKFKNLESPVTTLVGFENHSGLTKIGSNTEPLGSVIRGFGNMGDGGYEGGWYKNAIGTYLHGSLLPKNPWLADHLIEVALMYRYGSPIPLEKIDDSLEIAAHESAIERAKTAKTLSI
ncbi:MAG: glutamine amidotransferase [Patescibacteria group bacterium]|nr:glutamine amidotransferase [Patescibacteria group bacterium]